MNAAETRTIQTFVSAQGMESLEREIRRLTKVAARKGFEAPEVTHVGEARIRKFSRDGIERLVRGHDVTVTVPSFRLPGNWVLIGQAVRMEGESGERVTVINPANNGDQYLTPAIRTLCEAGDCQHCGFKRRRNSVYVVRSATSGAVQVVGSTCMTDFLGVDVAAMLYASDVMLAFERYLDSLGDNASESESFGGGGAPSIDLVRFLAAVVSHSGKHGFVSGREAYDHGGNATGREVFMLLRQP